MRAGLAVGIVFLLSGCGTGLADQGEEGGAGSLSTAVDPLTDPCKGPFTIKRQQPVSCLVYPQSLWNKKLPASKMTKVTSDSAAVVRALFTRDGRDAYPWTRASAVGGVNGNGKGTNAPLYYGQATDPVYVVAGATHPAKGIYNPIGKTFHAPSKALFSQARGDTYFAVWDQTTNLLFASYRTSQGGMTLPACPGNGHAGTAADPCPVSFGYVGVSNWTTDKGWGNTAADSLPSGGWATHIRAKEIMEGPIPHALFLFSDCMSGRVFPAANSSVTPCPSTVKHAPLGALMFLDYTPAQLADMKARLPLWQYRMIEALTVYGGYFGEASYHEFGGPSMPMVGRLEGPAAYDVADVNYSLYDWFKSFPHDPNNSDKSKALTCYTYNSYTGCNYNPYVGIPQYTGPACPTVACDISRHMHIAKECVALGLAGQPGGCL